MHEGLITPGARRARRLCSTGSPRPKRRKPTRLGRHANVDRLGAVAFPHQLADVQLARLELSYARATPTWSVFTTPILLCRVTEIRAAAS